MAKPDYAKIRYEKRMAKKAAELLALSASKYITANKYCRFSRDFHGKRINGGKANTGCPKGTSQSIKGTGQVFWGQDDITNCFRVVSEVRKRKIDRAGHGHKAARNFSVKWLREFLERYGIEKDDKLNATIRHALRLAYEAKLNDNHIII